MYPSVCSLAALRWAKIRFGGGTDWRLAQFIGARDTTVYTAGVPGVDIGFDAIVLHSLDLCQSQNASFVSLTRCCFFSSSPA